MQTGHQEQNFRQGHPRREAGPQSHGTPPEFAGLPEGTLRELLAPSREDILSSPIHLKRARSAGITAAVICALAAVPAAAQAAPVDLGTAKPFVVLGGQAVTNTGASVLNGDLGVAPGTALSGFGSPAVVNGATHNNDAVAGQAQSDLTTAYNVAAAQPSPAALTGQDLGNKVLQAGAYRFTSSAQLTGALTLDAAGDPNAQFVFMIGSTLTTASASSVRLINGASPCNVFWQVGSSATLGSTTAFQGNLMALTSISLNNGATVQGRVLARNGQVSLINNVINRPLCGTSSTTPGTTTPGSQLPPASQSSRNGTATLRRSPGSPGSRRSPRSPRSSGRACADGFYGTVRGRLIERVVFRLDGKRIASRSRSPFRVFVRALPGRHIVTARVTFKDATAARTLRMNYRACASASANPRRGPSRFTG